ncbi:peptidase S8/S53 domain-containing protein [Amylocarpus encephaloides]|uniref:Peptidase S8/S53 domain-containing protein n=1 Tax=Amylocarpus encephaloides TaxID=45428 RepID=A0A9P8C4Z8_9HELO|nr:peptidase S8/S53 domain-containing protein [Amylocarpus encephaloides]
MKLTWTLLFAGSVWSFVAERSYTPAPYLRPDSEQLVPEGYIVRFHPNHTLEDHFSNIGFDIRQFASVFMEMPVSNAYLFELSETNHSMIHDYIRLDPGVLRIEHDEYLHEEQIFEREPAPPPLTFVERLSQKVKRWVNLLKSQASWNQVMITLGKKKDFGGEANVGKTFYAQYSMSDSGEGVNVYVFDSGIKIEHETFQRYDRSQIASHFGGKKTSDTSPYCGSGVVMDDLLGHGTHVAGIISNRDSGAVHKANLINVKVQKCGGSIGKVETAVNDVITEHNSNKNKPPKGWMGSVINMSIGYTTKNFQGLQDALNKAKNAGIPIAAAAGNQRQDWLEIPARFASTFSVGAVDIDYNRWTGGYGGIRGSNYNKKLNIWAPGKSVWSSFIDDKDPKVTNKYEWASGTSMACPHVAGVMAIIMGFEGYTKLSAQNVYDRLNTNAISVVKSDDEIKRVGATLNLLQSGIKGGTRRPTFDAPYDGIPHDELKKAKLAAVVAESTIIDDSPMPTHAPPTDDTKDADEIVKENDGTDPDDPLKSSKTSASAPAPAPTSGPKPSPTACHCTEIGCTADPPGSDAGCCGSGTCGPDVTTD